MGPFNHIWAPCQNLFAHYWLRGILVLAVTRRGSSRKPTLSLPCPDICPFASGELSSNYVHWILTTGNSWQECDLPDSVFSIKNVLGTLKEIIQSLKRKIKSSFQSWLLVWWSQKKGKVEKPQVNLQLLLHLNPRDTFLQTPYVFFSFSECRTIHIIYTLLLTYLFEPCRHLTTDE